MDGRNRELESGCHIALITLVVVGCFAGIPALVDGITQAVVHARIDAPPMRFACRSCGEVEYVREVTLDTAKHNVSTISGEGFALFIALMTNKLDNQPVNVKEIAVRLQDGSVRVFHEAATAEWNEGDRVKISMGRIKPLS
jgi:hypothetical protein